MVFGAPTGKARATVSSAAAREIASGGRGALAYSERQFSGRNDFCICYTPRRWLSMFELYILLRGVVYYFLLLMVINLKEKLDFMLDFMNYLPESLFSATNYPQ